MLFLKTETARACAHGPELLVQLQRAADWIQEMIECGGGDDHSVGICDCSDREMLAEIRDAIEKVVDPEGWEAERQDRERMLKLMEGPEDES